MSLLSLCRGASPAEHPNASPASDDAAQRRDGQVRGDADPGASPRPPGRGRARRLRRRLAPAAGGGGGAAALSGAASVSRAERTTSLPAPTVTTPAVTETAAV